MSRPALRQTILAALFFAAATVLFTWPMAAHVGDGLVDLGDAKLAAWILRWDYHQILRDPVRLFEANIFYPARYVLAFSENLIGISALAFPLYAAGLSTLAVYNAFFLFGMFLSALAAWALARWMTGDAGAALVAGLVYAFLPWKIAHVAHLQFQWGAFLVLCLLFLLRYLHEGRRRDAVLFGIFLGWNALSNMHYALFSGILVAVVVVWELLTGGGAGARRVAVSLAICAGVGVAVVPVFLPYWKMSDYYGIRRGMEEIAFYSGRPIDFLRSGAANKLYGRWSERWPHPETEFFPGLTALALAVYALLRLRADRAPDRAEPLTQRARWRPTAARVCDALLLVALVLGTISLVHGRVAIGPLKANDPGRILVLATVLAFARLALAFPRRARSRDLSEFLRGLRMPREAVLLLGVAAAGVMVALGAHTPYYRFLVQSAAFVFEGIRVPARGIVLFDLALAVLAAWGARLVSTRGSRARRGAMLSAALLLIAVEYRAFPFEVHPVESAAAPVYRWLASQPVRGAVMEWPFGVEFDVEYVFRSTQHWKRIVNGASGFYPPSWVALEEALHQRPIPDDAWRKVPSGTSLLIWHAHDPQRGDSLVRFRTAAMRAVAAGRLATIAEFTHGGGLDFVFRITREGESPLDVSEDGRVRAERDLAATDFRRLATDEPPFGFLDTPAEGAQVQTGQSASGWALDGSGIAEVLLSADGGEPIRAATGFPHPGVRETYPGYPGADRAGFNAVLPALTSGEHVLTITFRATDGGESKLTRTIRVP